MGTASRTSWWERTGATPAARRPAAPTSTSGDPRRTRCRTSRSPERRRSTTSGTRSQEPSISTGMDSETLPSPLPLETGGVFISAHPWAGNRGRSRVVDLALLAPAVLEYLELARHGSQLHIADRPVHVRRDLHLTHQED